MNRVHTFCDRWDHLLTTTNGMPANGRVSVSNSVETETTGTGKLKDEMLPGDSPRQKRGGVRLQSPIPYRFSNICWSIIGSPILSDTVTSAGTNVAKAQAQLTTGNISHH